MKKQRSATEEKANEELIKGRVKNSIALKKGKIKIRKFNIG